MIEKDSEDRRLIRESKPGSDNMEKPFRLVEPRHNATEPAIYAKVMQYYTSTVNRHKELQRIIYSRSPVQLNGFSEVELDVIDTASALCRLSRKDTWAFTGTGSLADIIYLYSEQVGIANLEIIYAGLRYFLEKQIYHSSGNASDCLEQMIHIIAVMQGESLTGMRYADQIYSHNAIHSLTRDLLRSHRLVYKMNDLSLSESPSLDQLQYSFSSLVDLFTRCELSSAFVLPIICNRMRCILRDIPKSAATWEDVDRRLEDLDGPLSDLRNNISAGPVADTMCIGYIKSTLDRIQLKKNDRIIRYIGFILSSWRNQIQMPTTIDEQDVLENLSTWNIDEEIVLLPAPGTTAKFDLFAILASFRTDLLARTQPVHIFYENKKEAQDMVDILGLGVNVVAHGCDELNCYLMTYRQKCTFIEQHKFIYMT